MMRYCAFLLALTPVLGGCVVQNKRIDPTEELTVARVKPGITVLLGDSIGLRFSFAVQLALALFFLLFLLFQFLLALLVLIVWFCQWGTVFGKVGLETPL